MKKDTDIHTNDKIKILYIIPCLSDGGIERMIIQWIKSLDKEKFQVDVLALITRSEKSKAKLESLGCRVYDRNIRNRQIIKKKKYFMKVYKEGGYDIVHQHTNFTADYINLKYAKKAGIQIRICHGHSMTPDHGRINNLFHKLAKPLMRKYATVYTGCSEAAARELVGEKGIRSARYIATGNSVDCEKLRFRQEARDEIRAKYNLEGKFVIGHVGRFEAEKNHSFIIDVFAECLKRREDAWLLLVGDGSLRAQIEEKARRLGIIDRITFAGTVENVEDYYCAMDVFIFPSLYEGFGLALLEAQCNGLKCVATSTLVADVFVIDTVKRLRLKRTSAQWAKAVCERMSYIAQRPEIADEVAHYGFDNKDNGIDKLYERAIKLSKMAGIK